MPRKQQNARIERPEEIAPSLDGAEKSPEILATEQAHTEARRNVQLEILDEKSQAVLIERLSPNETPERQPETAVRFNASLSMETIPQMLEGGVDADLLKNIWDNPEAVVTALTGARKKHPNKFKKWDGSTRAAYEKLIEIARNRTSPFAAAWQPEYEKLLATTLPRYENAKTLVDHLEDGWDTVTGTARDVVDWARENKMKATLIGIGIIGVGALVKNLFSKSTEKNDEPEKSEKKESGLLGGLWEKGRNWILGGAAIGTLAILAKILPLEKMGAFVEEIWKDSWLGKKLAKADDKVEQLEKQNELYEQAAKKIGIDDVELLEMLGEEDYGEFVSFLGATSGKVGNKIAETFAEKTWGTFAEWASGFDLLGDNVKRKVERYLKKRKERPKEIAKAEAKLRDFFKKHDKLIREKIYPNHTIKQVLEGLGREGVFGEEFRKQPIQVEEHEVPAGVQKDIALAYAAVPEQNDAMTIWRRVDAHTEKHKKNIFDNQGLVARLEHLGDSNPEYKEKAEEVRGRYKKLEAERNKFREAIKAKTPLHELEKMQAAYLEMELEFEMLCTEYYQEIEPKLPAWAPLPFFVRRYALLGSRRRAMIRERIRRITALPKDAAAEALKAKAPIPALKKAVHEAEESLRRYREKNAYTPEGEKAMAHTGWHREWQTKIKKVEELKKTLTYEEARAKFEKLPAPQQTPSARTALLKAEYEMHLARQQAWKTNIKYLKEALSDAGEDISDRQRVKLMDDILIKKKAIRDSLKGFDARVLEHVKTLGKHSTAAQELVKHRDDVVRYYGETVRDELAFRNGVMGESKGLRNKFKEWIREERESGFVKFAKNKYGRVGIMTGLLALPLYFQYDEIQEKNPDIEFKKLVDELGLSAVQLLADVMPFTFGASDWYTLTTGKELVTKKEVTGFDRYSRLAWGTFGALLDAATIIPAVDVVGAPANAIMRTARAAGRAGEGAKLIRMWPRIAKVADAVGGWSKFGEYLKAYAQAGGKWEKVKAVAGMTRTAVPRAMAATMAGSIAYVYTVGPDAANDYGEALPADLVAEIEAETKPTNMQHQSESEPPAG